MHGVKGELLTRNRLLVPAGGSLAVSAGTVFLATYRFHPAHPIAPCGVSLIQVFCAPRVGAQSPWTAPIATSVCERCAASHRNLRRIFSIEPSIGGAGKKAAYDGRDEMGAIILPTGAEQICAANGERVDEGVPAVRDAATGVAGIRIRKEVSRVKESRLQMECGARMPCSLKNRNRRPLKLNLTWSARDRTKKTRGIWSDALNTLGESCHDQDC